MVNALPLLICFAVLLGCQHVNQRVDHDHIEFQKINEIMAEMEVHFTYLYLHLGEDHEWENCVEKVDTLIHYLRISKEFTPTVLIDLPEDEFTQMKQQYQKYAEQTLNLLKELRTLIQEQNYSKSKMMLDKIDQSRRDCHVLFG